jgi:hypothetical protein
LVTPFLFSQSVPPSLWGAWKADLHASKFAGPPVSKYIEIIEGGDFIIDPQTHQTVHGIKELTGSWSEEGGRELLTFSVNQPVVVPYQGVMARMTASVKGNQLEVRAEVPGGPIAEHRRYQLSSDENTLTIQSDQFGFGPVEHSTMVLRRQSVTAVEELRQPEETAGKAFKNVQTEALRKLPASELINRMHYFSWSLNKRCNFCHVMPFEADKKEQKRAAREMINMVMAMNQTTLKNTPIDCFTCHQFRNRPLLRPLFADEWTKQHSVESHDPTTLVNGSEPKSSVSINK